MRHFLHATVSVMSEVLLGTPEMPAPPTIPESGTLGIKTRIQLNQWDGIM